MQDREEISFLSVRNPNSFLPVRSTIVSSTYDRGPTHCLLSNV